MHLESVAFFPQLLLSAVVLPFLLAKKDLPSTMLAQTFAFVTFNKVCTSQVRKIAQIIPLPSTNNGRSSIFSGIWFFSLSIYLHHLSLAVECLA